MKSVFIFLFFLSSTFGQFAPYIGEISVLGIRVSFAPDNNESTTGDGTFLTQLYSDTCGDYFLDPPPHNKSYFEAQIKAANSYFRSISKEHFGIDTLISRVMPDEEDSSYVLDTTMSYYHPYGDENLQDQRLAEFFQESLSKAYDKDSLDFDLYDVIVIFHAGIGQDFNLPFLDPTPEDIPSTYIDLDFLYEQLDTVRFSYPGIILPETQNHLLYDIADDIFAGVSDPCDYQFGLTGTFALMLGFAIGLPPLWDTESGESGVGVFALMDQGSNNGRGVIPAPPDAWTRIYAGWESAVVVKPTTEVKLIPRDSLENQIVRVEINDSEYFLIENRNNWLFENVDIDSLRWRNRNENDVMPNYPTILIDSMNAKIDPETGVITSIPNYDLGLPGSGLLIWHIDENKIAEGIHSYSVNGDREYRGIDLEEADGAQDIGYPNIFLFTDPTSGMRWDMWFEDNEGYYFANPGFKDQLPSFGPDTYPNTRSNNGSDSYIEINDISNDSKIMRFTVANSLIADGFPDTSLYIHFFYDFTGDGTPEIIGGKDSLWWSHNDSIVRHTFYELPSDSFQLAVTNYGTSNPKLATIIDTGDSLKVSVFHFDTGKETFVLDWSQNVESDLPPITRGLSDLERLDLAWGCKGISISKSYVYPYASYPCLNFDPSKFVSGRIEDPISGSVDTMSARINDQNELLINYDLFSAFEGASFENIIAADIDLDGHVEIITTDSNSLLYAINSNRSLETGFPISVGDTPFVLVRDLFGDDHPEIVVQVNFSDIVVLNWRGKEQYRLSNPKGSELRMLSQYQGRNCIATESNIWLFDSTTTTDGNEWSYVHHDPSNRREFQAVLAFRAPASNKLIDTKRTYNYPNPVEGSSTTIRVFVESAEKVEVMIYDIAGYFVKKFSMDSPIKGEVNEVVWDVTHVESGVYFANVMATKGSESESKVLKIAVVH